MTFQHFLVASVFAVIINPTSLTADPIHDAAKSADIELLVELLDQGISIESANALGTPLHFAVRSGELEVVEFLLERGADANPSSALGSPLLLAVLKKNVPISLALLRSGANPNSEGKTAPIVIAAKNGDLELATALLENGAHPDYTPSNDGFRAIHEAARWGHVNMVDLLLERGASASLATARGETALHLAIKYMHDTIAARLRDITRPEFEEGASEQDVSNADPSLGKKHAQSYCGVCHLIGAKIDGARKRGPHLQQVVGKMSGTVDPNFSYSRSMQEADIVWSRESLDSLMQAAQSSVPGTKMESFPLNDVQIRAQIIAYLTSLGEQ